jgi:hypothetical protein
MLKTQFCIFIRPSEARCAGSLEKLSEAQFFGGFHSHQFRKNYFLIGILSNHFTPCPDPSSQDVSFPLPSPTFTALPDIFHGPSPPFSVKELGLASLTLPVASSLMLMANPRFSAFFPLSHIQVYAFSPDLPRAGTLFMWIFV